METAEPEENGDTTILAELFPGAAVVFSEVPAQLKLHLIDFGLVPAADRKQISTVLASIGNTASVAGNVRNLCASVQGIYRIGDESADAAALGPPLAMIALQMQLSEITGLVRTNIALTSQVLTTVRRGQWAELTALVATVDHVVDQAREIGSVPTSLWDTVAGKKADLRTQLDLYRLNVGAHIGQIHRLDTHGRREYLEAIQPLADALHPPAPPLEAAAVLCAPESLALEPYLRILRWFLEGGETLPHPRLCRSARCSRPHFGDPQRREGKLASEKTAANTLVAVTDRRVITAKTNAFLEHGEIRQDISIDRVRYVRAATTQDRNVRLAIDLITRDENIRWLFHADIDGSHVDALASVLAESIAIPDVEREELQRRRRRETPQLDRAPAPADQA